MTVSSCLATHPFAAHPFRIKPRLRALGLAALLTLASTPFASAEDRGELAGYDRFAIQSAHRAERISASLWYPVGSKTYRGLIGDNALFKGTYAYVGAGLAKGHHPLILLSHGSGGNMDAISWLSSGLALKGAMVLAVDHPGSRSGDSSPRRSIWRACNLMAKPMKTIASSTHKTPIASFSQRGMWI